MLITKDDHKGITILHCEGRLDATTSIQLEEAINELIDQNQVKVILEFCKLEYLSSAGMRLLLSMTKRLKSKNGKLAIVRIHDDVRDIITMAGFDKILAIYPSEEEAEKMMG